MRILRFLLLFLFSITLIQSPYAQVGIGVNNYHLEFEASVGSYRLAYIGVINPSPYDVKAKVYFECDNCVSDVKIFGRKIGEKIFDTSYITLDKDDVYVKAHTTGAGIPVEIRVAPRLILINKIKLFTPESLNFLVRMLNPKYKGYVTIPYPALFLGERKIDGRVVVNAYWSSYGPMGVSPAVASIVKIRLKGMPVGSLILLLIGISLVGLYLWKKIYPKAKYFKIKKVKIRRKKKKRGRG